MRSVLRTFEAFYRLRAAEQLVTEGRRAEADEQLQPALAFYRDVGASRYVREGEALGRGYRTRAVRKPQRGFPCRP